MEKAMKVILFATLMIILLTSVNVLSDPISTSLSAMNLFSACSEYDHNEYARGFCDGVIDALYSSIQNCCIPASITHGDVKNHVKDDLLKATAPLKGSAFEFVTNLAQKAWPCY
jgi:hypothetical protein